MVLPLNAGSECYLGSIESIGHHNAVILLSFKSSQVPEMMGLSWMARKFTRGMTYQWKAKNMANAQEDLHWVANIVI